MAIIYGFMLLFAAVLLVLYCFLIKEKEPWLITLYVCVCVANVGYLFLSLSKTVELALFFNKVAYLGNIFLLISMFFSIINLCGFTYKKAFPIVLLSVCIAVFAIVATTGYLPWYYESVRIDRVNGATKLVKEYGPLHTAYLAYVIAYFVAMIGAIVISIKRKMIASQKHAILLSAVVFFNIATWIAEKFIKLNFELLSISYVASVSIFFIIYWMMQDYVHKNEVCARPPVIIVETLTEAEKIKAVLSTLPDGVSLSARQTDILEKILDYKSRKEIAAELHLSENTVKTHTSMLYKALGVSGREEIYAMLNK